MSGWAGDYGSIARHYDKITGAEFRLKNQDVAVEEKA